jgi:hypothetical protein
MALALLLCNIIVCTPQRWPVDCSGHWWPHFSHLLMLEHHLHCISQGRFFLCKKIEEVEQKKISRLREIKHVFKALT